MEISARTMYGLRALVTLAGARSCEPMSIQTIADEEGLPGKFLEGIMADLKRGGFVRSKRGANGGYMLARPASEITLLSVIRHLDGPVAPLGYEDRTGAAEGEFTERQRAFGPVWCEVRDATIRVLERYTIQSIADSVPELRLEDFRPIYQI
ncbi:Rrf2 family transcriptional regulator [Bradymonadaceae bacterium TMQ3]|uniref:Rrf2 family transcriptional regulator n=1 Tax=Lujinxingia sediminis TaxID=2480984 RepID=A0ABY0CSM1_9DELT|nr:Rrf2 family transcriptional regulator [Lujinxingia sediminis]RDV38865.1 Rrf2 family transcriptional regulator [Bradymonadaceae bacterium TMQ3]RVU44100.1 Rrf2 family transcriptional regulator [Lujinxingia sediminis]TXC76362.1 Rrf2 family transcriptional regulator [Bradymonadales bacterium TMQ1]